MPDHIHLLIWPQEEEAVTDFMRDFKRFTSGRITRQAKVEGKTELIKKFEEAGIETERAEYKVWQDSFWEQSIYTEKFLKQKLDYIHLNPVRAGIVEAAEDYPYSSYRNYYLNDNQLMEIDSHWNWQMALDATRAVYLFGVGLALESANYTETNHHTEMKRKIK